MRLVAAVLALTALTGCFQQAADPRVIEITNGPTPAGAVLAESIRPLVNRTGDSYVTLVVRDTSPRQIKMQDQLAQAVTSGSGFIIDGQGHMVTAGHVAMQHGWNVDARGPDGRIYQGEVVAVSKSPDLALIKLSGISGARAVTPVSDQCLAPGTPVFSLGRPRSAGDVARVGEVASMSFGQEVTYRGFGYPDAMVLKLPTRKGESGGPVFTSDGRLAGMLVSTLSDGTGRHLDLAHALPASMVAQFVCDNLSCSSAWRALAATDTRRCTAS